jgi:formylglycine-generating enzyme required for sulfatase activity/serine/threonine protein kinase
LIFTAWLARHDGADEQQFAHLVQEHAEHAVDLVQLRAEWLRERRVAKRTTDASLGQRLVARFGDDIDPEVSLRENDERPGSISSTMIERISGRSSSFGRYHIQDEIARGGMGAIVKVWDEDIRRHLAMKVILGQADASSSAETRQVESAAIARFLEEAQVTGQLDHPGIVPVHELGLDEEGRVFFTMKLVHGRDLRQIFELVFQEKEGWNETRALSVMLRVCEAMAYAHTKGVIHRDLKPANIMVGNFGEVYVMDWGLARVLGKRDTHDIRLKPDVSAPMLAVKSERSETRALTPDSPLVTMDGDVVGTPAYMSPEQARGEIEKLSARSDVYSIGAMLYHLLARQTPYLSRRTRANTRTVLEMVLDGPPDSLASLRSDVPPELAAISEKAMSRSAADRYADTLALAEDLRAFLEHRVVSAHATGTWAETKKWIERNKALASALASAIVILVAGVIGTATFAFDAKAEARRADEKTAAEADARREAQRNATIAQQNESRAIEQERVATRTANDVLSLSAIQELKELVERADALWPAIPEKLGDYDHWLADAKVLIDGRAADRSRGVEHHPSLKDHEAKLAEIRLRAKPSPASASSPASNFADARAPEFEDAQDRWWHAQLSQLVADLTAFSDEKTGLFSDGISKEHGWGIVKRRKEAATLVERSLSGADARTRWDDAVRSIEKSPKYGGLKLTPQLGLVPIGEDAHSHLWEFAHLQSGEPTVRDADGKLALSQRSGLVLVLIPGGTFWMGAQKTDPSGHNYDPQALDDESPVHEVELSEFFLSKYEMTQGQWLSIAGHDPSYYGPGFSLNGHVNDLSHPIENVSWLECTAIMSRVGLTLPSEAQWEYACRAGTETPWSTGAERESLRGNVNLADQSFVRFGGQKSIAEQWPDLDDGWVVHAAVGIFAANAFGLHEVHGNVWEWCLDGYDPQFYASSPDLDPVAPWAGLPHVNRGGSFNFTAAEARSASRNRDSSENRAGTLGLRPARAITP